jgi:hypothetical protein
MIRQQYRSMMLLANSAVISEAAGTSAWKRIPKPNSWQLGDLWSAFPEFANSIVLCTVGESFELNIDAAQETGTLIKTAKPIILAQGSVWEKWNYSYSRTTHVGSIFPACPPSIWLK